MRRVQRYQIIGFVMQKKCCSAINGSLRSVCSGVKYMFLILSQQTSSLPWGFCSCSLSSASLSSASGRSILFTASKAVLETSSSLYNSSSLKPWWEWRDGEGKFRQMNAEKIKKSFVSSVSPWWEVEQHQRLTYTAFYWPAGNHRHPPAARYIKHHLHTRVSSN